MIRIHNTNPNEVIDREMTNDEFKSHQSSIAKAEAEIAEAKTKALAKSALLVKLGITEDEAKLLLG